MSYFQRILVNTLAFISLTAFFPTMVRVSGTQATVLIGFVSSVLDMFVKSILMILSLPFTLATLGLFVFVTNAVTLKVTPSLVEAEHFSFSSSDAALLVAISVSLVNVTVSEHNSREQKKTVPSYRRSFLTQNQGCAFYYIGN